MNLTNEFEPIRQWARERKLYTEGNTKTQVVKLMEEVGELSRAVLKNNESEFIDAMGDIVVVLVNLAGINKMKLEDCINHAFSVIENRTGKIISGTFVKDK